MQKPLVIIGVFLLGIVCFFAVFKKQTVSSYTENHFIINRPYREVMLGLATQNSLEQVASSNGGQIINKNWTNLKLNLLGFRDRQITQPVWIADCNAWFALHLDDPNLGSLDLEFVQQIYANPNGIVINTTLLKPSKGLYEHSTFISLEKLGENQTKCVVKSRMTVVRRHPNQWNEYVQQIVSESNAKNSRNTAQCIQEISERRGISIPFK